MCWELLFSHMFQFLNCVLILNKFRGSVLNIVEVNFDLMEPLTSSLNYFLKFPKHD
jgi:hypothetical protein